MRFGKTEEEVVTREEFPLSKSQKIFSDETIAVLGYGVQGQAQSLNMRDSGIRVIVGQRQNTKSWHKALLDGWVPNETLFPLEVASEKGSILMYLLSDAGQKDFWPKLQPLLTPGKTLYFSHGFSITYKELTGIIPPQEVDVILIAPKGSGLTVRRNYLNGGGTNSSFAIYQDATGQAKDKCLAIGIAIGSAYLFPTTFEKEVYCNLTAERGVLVGALTGIMEAQYNELRKHGHSASEAFNDTVEQLTQSLILLIGEKGMDWMYANISTTAQRGALDWKGKFRDAVAPVFADLYNSVSNGTEAQIVIEKNSRSDYRKELDKELFIMHQSEMWKAGEQIRKLRPGRDL